MPITESQLGAEAYFLLAQQTNFGAAYKAANLDNTDDLAYRLISATLARASEPIIPEESTVHGNPVKSIPGRVNTSGNLVMALRAENLQRILQWCLWQGTPGTNTVSDKTEELRAAATYTNDSEAVSTFTTDDPPSRIIFKGASDGSNSPAFASGQTAGTITVIGTGETGLELTEVIDVTDITLLNSTDGLSTTYYFASMTSFQVENIEGGHLSIDRDSDIVEVTLDPGDTPLFSTIELNKGLSSPHIYDSCMVNEFVIDISGGTPTLTADLLGRDLALGGVIEDANVQTRSGPGIRGLPADFSDLSETIFPPWGTTLTDADGTVALQGTTLTVSRNYEVEDYLTNERFYDAPVPTPTRLDARITGTLKYDRDSEYSKQFITNADIEDFKLTFHRYIDREPHRLLEFDFGRGEFAVDPDPAISTQGVITQDIEIRLLGSQNAVAPDYLKTRIRSTEDAYAAWITA